jgi:membrane protease YdiL (CAAX protease family)
MIKFITPITQKYPLVCYFILAFFLSWMGAYFLGSLELPGSQPVSKTSGLFMFPVMIVGVALAGMIVTAITEGKKGLRTLFSQMGAVRLSFRFYVIALFIPPLLILLTLICLAKFVSVSFAPNFFPLGFLFGIPAGLFEEIGWTGFGLRKMLLKMNERRAGIITGVVWGLWHWPVIDYLGSAWPHGNYLLPFFFSFVLLLTAMRVLMTWVYAQTQSIFIVQLMHLVSTGSLVVLGPQRASPGQEALWYFLYALLLWMVVLAITKPRRTLITKSPSSNLTIK